MIFPIGYRRRHFRHYGSPTSKPNNKVAVIASVVLLSIPIVLVVLTCLCR